MYYCLHEPNLERILMAHVLKNAFTLPKAQCLDSKIISCLENDIIDSSQTWLKAIRAKFTTR